MHDIYNKPVILPPLGKSDHNSVICHPRIKTNELYKMCNVQVTTRVSGHNGKCFFMDALSKVDWRILYNMTSCEDQFMFFSETLSHMIDTYLPEKITEKSLNDKPWVNQQFKNLVQTRQCFWMAKDDHNYNIYRNKVIRMAKKLKQTFYKNKVANLQNTNPHSWWKSINLITGKKANEINFEKVADLHTNGNLQSLADKLCEQFTNISTSMPKLNCEYIPNSDLKVMHRHIIRVAEVEKALTKVNLKKSSGPDNIPNWVLRDCSHILAGPITSIFNTSVCQGYIPPQWKCAAVVPINKIPTPLDITKDFRPISLTPVISKVFERFIYQWLLEIVQPKLDHFQFGAIKGSSTTHTLVKLIHEWAEHTDDCKNKPYVNVLFLDYAKAFDRINPNILIQKLKKYDIPGYIIAWICDFITDRKQCVKLKSFVSQWLEVWGNVPQGTLLGILLFLIMINDLQLPCSTTKFVDDTTAYQLSSHLSSPQGNPLQVAADRAHEWSLENGMTLNPDKSKELVINFSNVPGDDIPCLYLNGHIIERVPCSKVLGVIISSKLSWSEHITYIHGKASKRIYNIIILKRSGVATPDICKVYCACIRSILEYAAPVWHSGLTQEQSHMLENIQKRVLKIILPSHDYDSALQICNLQTLQERRKMLSKRFFKTIKKFDDKLNYLLLPNAPERNLRSQNVYKIPSSKTERYKNTFIPFCLNTYQC